MVGDIFDRLVGRERNRESDVGANMFHVAKFGYGKKPLVVVVKGGMGDCDRNISGVIHMRSH
jgi:hypothetical protein